MGGWVCVQEQKEMDLTTISSPNHTLLPAMMPSERLCCHSFLPGLSLTSRHSISVFLVGSWSSLRHLCFSPYSFYYRWSHLLPCFKNTFECHWHLHLFSTWSSLLHSKPKYTTMWPLHFSRSQALTVRTCNKLLSIPLPNLLFFHCHPSQ